MKNFCHNFFTIGKDAGYEVYYVRMGETGAPSPKTIAAYQNQKNATVASWCTESSQRGLLWRALFSLCDQEFTATPIEACSGFGPAEQATSVTVN